MIIIILGFIANSIRTSRDSRTDAAPSNASTTASWYFQEPLMKTWMSSTRYLQQRFPPGSIEYGLDIIYLHMHTNKTRYNIQNIKSFTHPVMRKGPKSIGESHSAASLAMWPSIAPPREKTATQLPSRGLWGSLTKIIRSPCLTLTGHRT